MKKIIISVLLVLSFCLLAAKPFQIGVVNPLQIVGEDESIKGLKLNRVSISDLSAK